MKETRKELRKDISKLSDQDLVGLLLYAIYKLTDDPNYSAISELIYCLDRENLLNLCSTFGGCTIKIPTLSDMENLTKSLLIYQEVNDNNVSFNQACNKHNIENMDRKYLYNMYIILKEILKDYE